MRTILASFPTAVMLIICLLALVACGSSFETQPVAASPVGSEPGHVGSSANTPTSLAPLRVAVIDVGKGDCILIQCAESAVLIDTGYQNTADKVLSQMQKQGVSRLDAIIITHYDRDHLDGLRTIGEAVDVGIIYLPGYEGADKNYKSCISSVEALGVPTQRVTKELAMDIGSVRLTVFPSGVAYKAGSGKEEGNDNDMSLVASLANGRDSYLFAGDLEEEGIAAYLAANHGQFDVLKMPHHGRRSSNTEDFLDDVRPKIAVITDSSKEPADKKTLKLLKSADVETYRSSEDGTVVVESDGNGSYSVAKS